MAGGLTGSNEELKSFNPALAERPQVVAVNKMDLPESKENYSRIRERFQKMGREIFPLSAVTGEGVNPLIAHVVDLLPGGKKKFLSGLIWWILVTRRIEFSRRTM